MKNKFLTPALLTLLLSGSVLPTGAMAADKYADSGIFAKERFMVRGRIIDVIARGAGTVDTTALQTDVDTAIVPEIDLTYRMTNHWALELIAATSRHDIYAGNNDLGSAWILPPTLTLQYHFNPDNKVSPYIGAGVNYSLFYGENNGTGFKDLTVKGGFGWALQAGTDIWLNDKWGVNFDVKYVDLNIDVTVNNGGSLRASDVRLDPVIAGVGISYRF